MNKALLYCLGYIALISIVAFFILSGTDKDVRYVVSGWDAFAIAASRPLYWVFIVAGIIAIVFAVRQANKMIKAESHAAGIHALLGIAALIFVATIFKAPADIKADPIGAGATTKQIEYLRSKGMDK